MRLIELKRLLQDEPDETEVYVEVDGMGPQWSDPYATQVIAEVVRQEGRPDRPILLIRSRVIADGNT
jgi:hypothetical protein